MSFSAVERHINLIADLFMGAASAKGPVSAIERDYVRRQLEDLLSVSSLPPSVADHVERFDPMAFDVNAAARTLYAEPPMRLRRLLELCAFVTVSDGAMAPQQDRYIRKLGSAFGMSEDEYRDLTLAHESKGPRRTFTQMAVVEVPGPSEGD